MLTVTQRPTLGTIDPDHPDLYYYLQRLHEHTTSFSHQNFAQPTHWYGLTDEEGVVCAYGWDTYRDGTVEVRYAVCRPCREGLKSLEVMARLLDTSWRDRRVIFHVQVNNKRMLRIVSSLGAHPIAVMMERSASCQKAG